MLFLGAVMNLVDLAFPFLVGVFSFFSPCAFPLIPGYIGYLMGGRAETGLGRSIVYGLACVAGVLVSTVILGMAAALVKTVFTAVFFWVRLVLAAGIIVLGAVFLSPLELSVPLATARPRRGTGAAGFFFYGMFFGPVVFSCQLPLVASIFLYSLTVFDALESFFTFIVYGLGLGLPLLLISMATAKARQVFVRKASRYYPWIRRAGGAVLILVGFYLLAEALLLLA
ncbi:MAG: cytochrome c biogenesis CcdA family protein [Candidatus Hecatellaceae archaeon]